MGTTSPRRWLASITLRPLAISGFALAAGLALSPALGRAQAAHDGASAEYAHAVASWIALDAAPGYERQATDAIMAAMPGWHRDALGNLVIRRGSGRPRRVVACGLDQPGYVVSAITDDGYLRLHNAERARRSPLWDQFHEGQRIRILTARGEVPGVVGVRSVHLWRGRSADSTLASIEDFWVDVGARTRAEVAALGIRLLDQVSRDWPSWEYADLVAGPAAASRAGCAAVAAAARSTPAHGETIFVISAQSSFGWAGLAAVVAPLGEIDTLVVAAPIAAPPRRQAAAPSRQTAARPPFAPIPSLRIGATVPLALDVSFAGTLVESAHDSDAARYFRDVAAAAGVTAQASERAPVAIASGMKWASGTTAYAANDRARSAATSTSSADSLDRAATLLSTLTNTYAVSGHEAAMRVEVRQAMPAWARARARVDTAGSIVLAMGPDRDTAVFVAHLDEVGFEIAGIDRDGTVHLRTRGGFFPSLWEGQTAIVHFDGDSLESRTGGLRGIFVPRERPTTRQPRELTAWFGMDSAALVARGAHVGQSVTSYKAAARLGAVRFTNRAIDDRAGCTALLLALRAIDPAKLTHKVIFLWSVREETGLDGATAFANEHGLAVDRVHAIDTFVSSDSPLESHRFADTPLGLGPVVRALDNSSATPPADVDHVMSVARTARIPMQLGTTNGGNDGSAFVRYGTIDVPIGWPLRYSHSPAEVADLRDVTSLARVVAALAMH
ncbi:MAG TPA: M20/M25/M40 family metallo-hydrolase [Gemmatimonadaceae bacterium]